VDDSIALTSFLNPVNPVPALYFCRNLSAPRRGVGSMAEPTLGELERYLEQHAVQHSLNAMLNELAELRPADPPA